jgi:hypothetical protein
MSTLDEDNTYLTTVIDRLSATIESRDQRIRDQELTIERSPAPTGLHRLHGSRVLLDLVPQPCLTSWVL